LLGKYIPKNKTGTFTYPNLVKTNWDVDLDIPNKKIGVGVVVRDESGTLLASFAEAVAPWKAVVFSSELGFPRVIFEGDALEVVNALKQDSSCWSRYRGFQSYFS
jgi:hypothetical protein